MPMCAHVCAKYCLGRLTCWAGWPKPKTMGTKVNWQKGSGWCATTIQRAFNIMQPKFFGRHELPSMTMVMWSVNNFSRHAYSLKLQNLQKMITEGKLVEMLAKRSKGKQQWNVKQFPCNPQVPPAAPSCPQVPLGSARQFTPIKAAGLPTCLLGPPVVKLPLLLLHSTDTFLRCCTLGHPGADLVWSWSSTMWLQRRHRKTILTTRMWNKTHFRMSFL